MTRPPSVTVIVVAYRTSHLDLGWVPEHVPVVVVRNDATPLGFGGRTTPVTVLDGPANVGYGAAVNRALSAVRTQRVVLCNPDVALRPYHWEALATGGPDQLRTIPLQRTNGSPTAVVEPYPRPRDVVWKTLANGTCLPSALPAGVRRVLGRWMRAQHGATGPLVTPWSQVTPPGSHPLRERWVCGAVWSVDRARVSEVGGFDPAFFLYFEDVELCRRLADRWPTMTAVVADVPCGVHQVGGTARTRADRLMVRRSWRRSAVRYAAGRTGWRWRVAEVILHLVAGPFLLPSDPPRRTASAPQDQPSNPAIGAATRTGRGAW
jgi:N-acetylglucosaminyl-diphospho-decaprenol L-rhamnosyltransferase